MTLDQVIIKEREDKIMSLNLDPDEISIKFPAHRLPPIERINEAIEYFKNELEFTNKQFQSFPYLLNYSIEDNIKPTVEYYRNELGFESKQFQSLPHLLGCSIEDNIKPKVEYYRNELGFENKQFQSLPSLLSYSLEKRIKPRTEFLRIKKRNIPTKSLIYGNELFCKKLAKCPLEEYESFKEDYLKK